MESRQLSFNFELVQYKTGSKYRIEGVKCQVTYLCQVNNQYLFLGAKDVLHRIPVDKSKSIMEIIKRKKKKKTVFARERAYGILQCERFLDDDLEMIHVFKVCSITKIPYTVTLLYSQFSEIISKGWLISNIVPNVSLDNINFIQVGATPEEIDTVELFR